MLGSRSRSLTFLALALLGAACSASSNFNIVNDDGGASDGASSGDGSTKSDGGGKDGSTGDAGQGDGGGDSGTGLTFHGKLVDFQSAAAIAGGTVSGAGHTAMSDVNGVFDLSVGRNVAFTATGTAAGYVKLIGQELSISDYDDFGFLPMISTSTSSLLQGVLSGYDPSKGVIIVLAVATGTCASESGATLSVSPGGSTVNYFSGGGPSMNTSISAGEAPSAVIYNVPPGVALTLSVNSPSCTQAAYPFTQGVLTYTGAMKVEAGNAVTAARVFLQ